jgi:hypothetical protein
MSADPVVYEYDSGHQTRQSKIMQALALVASAGDRGLTSRELGIAMYGDDTSGKSRSGSPLTRLHQEGRLAALAERRDGHHVYVLPEHVAGRETWGGYRHRGHCATCSCNDDTT